MDKTSLEIIIDSLTDLDWAQLKLKRDARRAFHQTEITLAKKTGAIAFADWILKHPIAPANDVDGSICWINTTTGYAYNSVQLHNLYEIGYWDGISAEDDEE